MRILLVNDNAKPSRTAKEHKSVHTNLFVVLIIIVYETNNLSKLRQKVTYHNEEAR